MKHSATHFEAARRTWWLIEKRGVGGNFCPGGAISGVDSSVGIATRYGLDGPGIESRWERDFPHPSRPAMGPTQPPIQWVPCLSRG